MSNDYYPAIRFRKRLTDNRCRFTSLLFVRAKVQNHSLIFLLVHLLLKIGLQPHAIDIFEHTKEDRELPGFAVPFKHLVNTPQPFWVSDVVTNQVASTHNRLRQLSAWSGTPGKEYPP